MRNNLVSRRFHQLLLITFLSFITIDTFAQPAVIDNYTFHSRLPRESGITFYVKKVQNPCPVGLSNIPKRTFFGFYMSGIRAKYASKSSKYVLNLVLKYRSCKNNIEFKKFSIELNSYNEGVLHKNERWYFEGAEVLSFSGEINLPEAPVPTCQITDPTQINASSVRITAGETSQLFVSDDANLCGKAQWFWYAETCGDESKLVGSGSRGLITVSPTKTTTYWVRAEDGRKKYSCVGKTIFVDQIVEKPLPAPRQVVRKPIQISGVPSKPICPGEKITLTVSGGLDKSTKRWVWRENSCDGDKIISSGSVSSLTLNETTTLYVRDESDDESSECATVKIEVKKLPALPILTINNGQSEITTCEGSAPQLQANAESLYAFKVKWFKDNPNSSPVSNDFNYSPIITAPGVFYVQGTGDCNSKTNIASIRVQVIYKSVAPSSVSSTKVNGKNYQLSVVGGSLEPGANWKWRKGTNCNGELIISDGGTITHNLKNGNTVSVIAEGGTCGTSSCVPYTIPAPNPGKGFGFINVGIIDMGLSNFSLTVGGKRFYLRYKTGIKNVVPSQDIAFDNSFGYVIPSYSINSSNYYEFNGQESLRRSAYTAGVMLGGKSVRVYLGGGLGEVTPLWGVDLVNYSNPSSKTSTWGVVTDQQRKGPEFEAGLFLKLGVFNVMGGINFISDKANGQYIDGMIGVGITF